MLTGRDADDERDSHQLANFRCTMSAYPCADEVEEFVQSSLAWRRADSGRVLKVFVIDSEIVAVAGYERLDPADPSRGIFIAFVAVSHRWQRREVGTEIVLSLFDDLAECFPGANATWRVHVGNLPPQALARSRLPGVEPTLPFDTPGYLEYTVELGVGPRAGLRRA